MLLHRNKKDFEKNQERDRGVFIYPVDADDLISDKVVGYENNHNKAYGFKSIKGYVWKKGNNIYNSQNIMVEVVIL